MNKNIKKCRLCLKLGDFCSIFDDEDSVKLSTMVMSFTNIKIHEGDGLPAHVCISCIENLSTAYLFKQQCERSDQLLRSNDATEKDNNGYDFNGFIDKEFHMHNQVNVQSDNNTNFLRAERNHAQETSETDSDVDSIKCVYCSQSYNTHGAHRCHVTCTIENNQYQTSSSNETLVAIDNKDSNRIQQPANAIDSNNSALFYSCTQEDKSPSKDKSNNSALYYSCNQDLKVPCVLCDDTFSEYDAYVTHVNMCTANVRLHHFVCPICHEICTDKSMYFQHLKMNHFKANMDSTMYSAEDSDVDCVDSVPFVTKWSKPKAVRRQIGWSVEDIYQEIECQKVNDKPTPTSSPMKNFFSKLGNESHSTPVTKKVSFKKLIEDGKAKAYNPFRRYFESYRLKRKSETYSPSKMKQKTSFEIKVLQSDSEYSSPSGTSEESWKMKQNLICVCDKKIFMLSEFLVNRDRIASMIKELGGVVAENTKMEMLATHFISDLAKDTFTGMMVCALATGKWLLHVSFVYDSFRCKKFMQEGLYEWHKHPKILEVEKTSMEVAKAAIYWHLELQALDANFPFEGKQIVLIMKKKYRQYYQMIFKALKAKPLTYDPRTPGSCCTADYCFVDMKIIERVKLRFFAQHNVPVFPYQYILIYLLNKGNVKDERKYLLQDCRRVEYRDTEDFLNNTY